MSRTMPFVPRDIEDAIVSEQYHHFPGTHVVVCCVTMKNGWSQLGSSVCYDSMKFDMHEGEVRAFHNAIYELRKHENYARMKQKE